MIHESVDLARWTAAFPVHEARERARQFVRSRRESAPTAYRDEAAVEAHIRLMSPGGAAITSPRELAFVEQIRAEALAGRGLCSRSTDVFLFARGVPAVRQTTCIGGLPYWPADRAWPASASGQPMTFLAQFSFLDSTDIAGDLPAPLLLLFADGKHGVDWDCSIPERLSFHWMALTDARLVDERDIPRTGWDIMPCYGHIHRTVDYIGAAQLLGETCGRPWCIDVLEGTKIGGVPRWIQGEEELKGRFLCSLGSIRPVYDQPYPFINVPGAWGKDVYAKSLANALSFGDGGMLYVFVDDSGRVDWTDQCY